MWCYGKYNQLWGSTNSSILTSRVMKRIRELGKRFLWLRFNQQCGFLFFLLITEVKQCDMTDLEKLQKGSREPQRAAGCSRLALKEHEVPEDPSHKLETKPRHHIPMSRIPTMPRAPPLCSTSVYLFQISPLPSLRGALSNSTAACQHHGFTVLLEQHIIARCVCRAWKTHVLNECFVSSCSACCNRAQISDLEIFISVDKGYGGL